MKNLVTHELLASTVPDDQTQQEGLFSYFLFSVRQTVPEDIAGHRLRREIIATTLADELVDRVGPGTIFWLQERFGVGTVDAARAYIAVSGIFLGENLRTIVSSEPCPETLRETTALVERSMAWLLRHRRRTTIPADEIARYADGVDALAAAESLSATWIADRHHALALTDLADETKLPGVKVAEVYLQIDQALGLHTLSAALAVELDAAHEEILARPALSDDLLDVRATLVADVLSDRSIATCHALLCWSTKSRRRNRQDTPTAIGYRQRDLNRSRARCSNDWSATQPGCQSSLIFDSKSFTHCPTPAAERSSRRPQTRSTA